jgi:hypothetical protein
VLIALDTSASMLDDTIVNVIRRRNMDDERKRMAPKWQRAVRTVEWLSAQLPLDAHFQIYGFDTDPNAGARPRPGLDSPRRRPRAQCRPRGIAGDLADKGSSLVSLWTAINVP